MPYLCCGKEEDDETEGTKRKRTTCVSMAICCSFFRSAVVNHAELILIGWLIVFHYSSIHHYICNFSKTTGQISFKGGRNVYLGWVTHKAAL